MSLNRERLPGPDGLRGFAALWVVFYHLWGALQRRDTEWIWGYIVEFFEYGFLGVDVFFVLSGFVIAYSLTGRFVNKLFVPIFLIKRSIRIDPPYWLTIFLALVFIGTKNIIFPQHGEHFPSLNDVVVHMLYLQDLLGYDAISSVFWTLCLEFQFYIIFSSLVWFLFNNTNAFSKKVNNFTFVVVVFVISISVIFRFSTLEFPVSGTIAPYAYEFVLGIFSCQYLKGNAKLVHLVVVCSISFLGVCFYKGLFFAMVPVLTVVLILGSARNVSFFSVLNCHILQYLGRISYSLYLTHAIVGWVTISLLIKIFSSWPSPIITVAIFLVGLSVSIIFANIFYFYVEKYFIGLSRSLLSIRFAKERL